MTALITAVFLASLLGSLHCAGMCAGFLAFAVATPTTTSATINRRAISGSRTQSALHLAYNTGRLITYSILGALSGALGAAVDLGGSALGLQRAAAILAGALMVGFGAIAFLRLRAIHLPSLPLPATLRTLTTRAHRAASTLPPAARALAIGLLTTLLPCGWLYAFAITAAGTASPFTGALTMAVFWAGTLPMMLTLGIGLQKLTGPFRRRLPFITSLTLIAVGLFTIAGRLATPAFAHSPAAPTTSPTVPSLDTADLPCCRHP